MRLEPQPSSLPSAGPQRSEFLHSLTGLRFYAALAVFLSHLELFHYFSGISGGSVFAFMKGLGAMGVSLFFVLSGFVLFINYLSPAKQAAFSMASFYTARFARIYPLFFFSILFALPLVLTPSQEPFPWFNLAANLTMLNTVFPGIGFFNIPAWTINVEAFFYALFPLLALLFRGNVRRNLLLAFAGFILLRFLTSIAFPHSEYLAAEYFPANRLPEFLAGMALGSAYANGTAEQWQSRFTARLAPGWYALLVTLILLMSLRPVFDGLLLAQTGLNAAPYHYYYYLPFSALLIAVLVLLEKNRLAPALLIHPWIILGGEISYAFYLLHRSIMLYTTRILEQGLQVDPTTLPLAAGLLLGVLLLAVCCVLAYASYQWFEKPCRSLIRSAIRHCEPGAIQKLRARLID